MNYTGLVHDGFVYDYKSISSCIINSIVLLVEENQDCNILITGHSLGGSLAVLTALELLSANITQSITLYTYG